MKSDKRLALLVIVVLFHISVTGCVEAGPEPTLEVTPGEEVIVVQLGTQARYDGLTIGSGNAWLEDASDGSGSVWRAALWLNEAAQGQTVHLGDVLTVDGYQLRVIGINDEAVTVAISEAP